MSLPGSKAYDKGYGYNDKNAKYDKYDSKYDKYEKYEKYDKYDKYESKYDNKYGKGYGVSCPEGVSRERGRTMDPKLHTERGRCRLISRPAPGMMRNTAVEVVMARSCWSFFFFLFFSNAVWKDYDYGRGVEILAF